MLRRPGEPPEQSEPGVLVEIRDDGAVRSIADLEDVWGSLFADADGGVWMLGFDRAGEAVQLLDPTSGAVSSDVHPIEVSGLCAAIAEGWLIDTELASEAVSGRQRVHHPRLQRLADPDRKVVDSVSVEPTVRVVGRTAWFPGDQQGTLVAVEVPTGVARTVTVLVDVREALPAPMPPMGVDLPAFERSSVAQTAAAIGFRHDWDRLTITAATLDGSFPDSAVVVRFTVDGQDGSYARRLALYDELGNTAQMEDLLGQLHEDANTGWIPPVADCTRDNDGTAWC